MTLFRDKCQVSVGNSLKIKIMARKCYIIIVKFLLISNAAAVRSTSSTKSHDQFSAVQLDEIKNSSWINLYPLSSISQIFSVFLPSSLNIASSQPSPAQPSPAYNTPCIHQMYRHYWKHIYKYSPTSHVSAFICNYAILYFTNVEAYIKLYPRIIWCTHLSNIL